MKTGFGIQFRPVKMFAPRSCGGGGRGVSERFGEDVLMEGGNGKEGNEDVR